MFRKLGWLCALMFAMVLNAGEVLAAQGVGGPPAPVITVEDSPLSNPMITVLGADVEFSLEPGSTVRVGVLEISTGGCGPAVKVVVCDEDTMSPIFDPEGNQIGVLPPFGTIVVRPPPAMSWRSSRNEDGEMVVEAELSGGFPDAGMILMSSVYVGCSKAEGERCNFTGTCCTPPPMTCGPSTDFSVGGGETATVSCNDPVYSDVRISTR